MTRTELFRGNIALTKQHLLEVLAHPERFDWIPDGAHVIGLPQNDRALFEANIKLAQRLASKNDGCPIILLPEVVKRTTARPKRAPVVRARAAGSSTTITSSARRWNRTAR